MFKNFFQMWENNLQYFCENNFFQEIFFSRFFWNFLSNIFAKKKKKKTFLSARENKFRG